jgi:hypothetical protein
MLPGVDATFAATNHMSASGMTVDISNVPAPEEFEPI